MCLVLGDQHPYERLIVIVLVTKVLFLACGLTHFVNVPFGVEPALYLVAHIV